MIFSKKNTRFSVMGMLAAVFTAGCLLTGCGDSADAKGDAAKSDLQYLLYKKEGDAKKGYYIHVFGLNTECDPDGKPIVNLDEIVSKKQGKIEIPAVIDDLPVKKVSFDIPNQRLTLGGTAIDVNGVSIRTVAGSEPKCYLNNPDVYYGYISEIVLPDGVENVSTFSVELDNLTIPASVKDLHLGKVKGKLVVPAHVYGGFFTNTEVGELEVFETDNAPARKEMTVNATKSAKIPENVKKINLRPLFSSLNDTIYPNCKGFELTCAPDAVIKIGDSEHETKYRLQNLQYGDIKVNGKDIKDILK